MDNLQTGFEFLRVRPIATTTTPSVWDIVKALLEGLDREVLVLDRFDNRDLKENDHGIDLSIFGQIVHPMFAHMSLFQVTISASSFEASKISGHCTSFTFSMLMNEG